MGNGVLSLRNPAAYGRRILVAVTGLSPQVVTETLYALAVLQQPAFVPTEIHLITTGEGANRARLALLSESPGGFHALCRDYQLPFIDFTDAHIHVLSDAMGRELEDIRSEADNRIAANLMTAILRDLTADSDSAVHVSIAGGRKSMGFFIGYALTLFGRPQDRLSHVLVSAPFESSYQFFYPTPYSRVIEVGQQCLADTATAQVTLADIPFVSLRHGLPESLLLGQATYDEAVAAARRALGPATLVLDLQARCLAAAGVRVTLAPNALALMAVFVRRLLRGEAPLGAPPKDAPDPAWAARFLAELRRIVGPFGDMDAAERALRKGMDGNYFSTTLSRLHSELKRQLGLAAAPYLIHDGGRRPRMYALTLLPAAVSLCE